MRPVVSKFIAVTKNTRLMNDEGAYDKIKACTRANKMEHLDYMLNTIKSSWEFVITHLILEMCQRGFTHQFVRTRQGSYLNNLRELVDMTGFEYYTPERIIADGMAKEIYDGTMEIINQRYQQLITAGVSCRRCQRNITN